MLILIAESKTMSEMGAPRQPQFTAPRFEAQASEIMDAVAVMESAQVAAMLHCSSPLAVKSLALARRFADKAFGLAAIDAFTGVVFRSLDAATLSADAALRCRRDVRIVSSVYGLLRPDDFVQPYRMEFSASIDGLASPLKRFWKPKLTVAAGSYMRQTPDASILVVLPADAAACFDWKLLRAFGPVGFVELREYRDGRLATPRANRLKERRGALVRLLLEQNAESPAALRSLRSPDFEFLEESPWPGRYVMLC